MFEILFQGFYPRIHDKGLDSQEWLRNYCQTYLERDVREMVNVGDIETFSRFLRLCAGRSGQLLNLASLASDAGISHTTARRWLSILEASFIIMLLRPHHRNFNKRMIKSPKLYFLDTGLCAYLTGWSSPETLEAGAMSGAILETWIMGELLKSYLHHGRAAPFFFYRDKDQREIDLLIERDGTLYPLEFKKSAAPGAGDVRHFPALARLKVPVGPGGIICLVSQPLPLTPTVQAIPVSAL